METREIKFRYRYTDGQSWIMKVFTLDQIVNGEPHEVFSDQPLLKNYKHVGQDQFTGLQDKVGQAIYDGDRLQDPSGEIWIVYWYADHACFGWYNEKQERVRAEIIDNLNTKVIGNVHQPLNTLTRE